MVGFSRLIVLVRFGSVGGVGGFCVLVFWFMVVWFVLFDGVIMILCIISLLFWVNRLLKWECMVLIV